MNTKKLGFALFFIFVIVIAALLVLGDHRNFENPVLLLVLNTVFLGVLPALVAVMAGRAYRRGQGASALLMSAGMLVFGLGSVVTGILRGLPDSANISVTVYTICALLGGVCHLAASLAGQSYRVKLNWPRCLKLTLALSGVALFAAALTAAAIRGLTPAFFTQSGSTRLRDIVLWLSVVAYVGAAISFIRTHRQHRSAQLFWFALALLFIALGLFTVWAALSVGSPAGWAGRFAQYTGGVFALVSILHVWNRSRRTGLSQASVMADFFSDAQVPFRCLANLSIDAILTVDEGFRIHFANAGAARLFGPGRVENGEANLLGLFSDAGQDVLSRDMASYIERGETGFSKAVVLEALGGDGRVFPAETTVSYTRLPEGVLATLLLHDITQRRENQRRIHRQNALLSAINQVYGAAMASATVQDLARACLDIVETATQNGGVLLCRREKDGALEVLAAKQKDRVHCALDRDAGLLSDSRCPLLGLCTVVAETGVALETQDGCSIGFGAEVPPGCPGIHDFLGVPYIRQAEVRGILAVADRPDGCRPEDREALETLAPVIFEALEAKRADIMLKDSEARFAAFMHAGPLLAMIRDAQGRYLYMNRTSERVFNMGGKGALGKTNHDLLPRSRAHFIDEIYRSVLESGQTRESVEPFEIPGEGRTVWRMYRFPFRSVSGQALLGCIGLDVTAAQAAQEALARSEALLRAVIDGTDDPVYLKDREGRFLLGNRAVVAAMGARLEDILGKTDREVYRSDDVSGPVMENDGFVLRTATMQTFEEVIPTPAGERIYLSTKTPWLNGEGKVIGLIGVSQDITDRKRMERDIIETQQALRKAKDDAEAASEAKGRFLANMSHEIRTPINSIIGYLDILTRTPLTTEQQYDLLQANLASRMLLRIIDDILDFSIIENGRLNLQEVPFSLLGVIQESTSMVYMSAQEKGLKMDLSLDDGLPDRVMGDPLRLKQALGNILQNAVKFTGQGSIHLSVDAPDPDGDGALIRFSVRDTGRGIAREKLSSIFESFTQEDESITRSYGGSGLGLAISRELVQRMGGNMLVQSSVGQGSTFTFTVRLRRAAPEQAEADGPGAGQTAGQWLQRPGGEPFRILLVEDNEMNRAVALKIMEMDPLRVDTAANGLEALQRIESQPPYDMIFMDFQMPVMDGYKATEAIRARESGVRHTPIVAMTAHVLPNEREKAKAAGMDYYITKPFTRADVLPILNRYLGADDGPGPQAAAADVERAVAGLTDEVGFDPEEALAMVREFLSGLARDGEKLAGALDREDREEAAALLHGIKGIAANLRLGRCYEAVSSLEAALRGNLPGEAARLAAFLSICREAGSYMEGEET